MLRELDGSGGGGDELGWAALVVGGGGAELTSVEVGGAITAWGIWRVSVMPFAGRVAT